MTEQTKSREWIGHGVWAVADQGIYAVATALLNILLARWLLPAEYGAFAVAYSVFLLIGAFHVALLLEPMLVFGPGRYAGRFAEYFRVLVRGNYALTLAGSLLLLATGSGFWIFGSRMVGQAFLGLAVAAPGTLFMWLVKRAAYVQQRPRLGAIQSGIYFILLLSGLFVLKSLQAASVLSALLAMGFAGAVAGLWLIRRLRALNPDVEDSLDRQSVLQAHWGYGRWALLTGVLVWVPLNFYFVVLSTWIGLEATASLKALTNLVLPLLQANAALSSVLLPLLVKRSSDAAAFRRLVDLALLLFAAVAVPYALLIGFFGGPLVGLLYGGRYHAGAQVMWLLALIPILDGVQAVLGCALRSLQLPRQIFRAQLCAAACVLGIGTAAAGALGVPGAAGAIVLASLLAAGMLARALSGHLAKHQAKQLAGPELLKQSEPVELWAKTPMQSFETQNHCDLCGELGALYGRDRGYDLLSCPRCGLLWTNPLKGDAPLATTNADYFGEAVYLANSVAQKNRFRSQLKTFLRKSGAANVQSLRVLEVGSGLGFFLDACKEMAIAAEGCDIVERAVQFANREEQRVRLGTLDDHYHDNSFDAIFAFNLIEHLPHPKEFLTQAQRILKPGGTLVLETPIQDGLFHRMARAGQLLSGGRLNFFGMEPGGHIYKFSKKTFRQESGFRQVYQRNVHSPFRELWGNSSLLSFDYKFVYRWSLPVAWAVARMTKQENRLFVMLGKFTATQGANVQRRAA